MSSIAYNASIQQHAPVSIDADALPAINVKDVKLAHFIKAYPQYAPLVESLASMVEPRRYLSVSVHVTNFQTSKRSCLDTGWHLDGKMNSNDPEQYALICFGPDGTRTMFHQHTFDSNAVKTAPSDMEGRRELFTHILGHDLHDESKGFEVGNGVPITYTTFDFHKGRIANSGRRVFIRVMSSNVIRHKALKRRY